MDISWLYLLLFAIWGLPMPTFVSMNIDAIVEAEIDLPENAIKFIALVYGALWPMVVILNVIGLLIGALFGRKPS